MDECRRFASFLCVGDREEQLSRDDAWIGDRGVPDSQVPMVDKNGWVAKSVLMMTDGNQTAKRDGK